MRNSYYIGRTFEFNNSYMQDRPKLGKFLLCQLGEMCCESEYVVAEHIQYCHEISYIISGSAEFTFGEETYHVKKGDLFINPKGKKHKIKADAGSKLRFFYLAFEFAEPASEEPYLTLENFFTTLDKPKQTDRMEMQTLLFRTLEEFYVKKPGFIQVAASYVELIIFLTWRNYCNGINIKYMEYNSKNDSGSAFYSVIRYIDTNILTLGTIKEIASKLGYSYTYLSHMFHCKAGITLQQYINTRRIDWARQMLLTGNMPIKQISEALGYETLHSFSRAFSKIAGICPSKYRQLNKNDKV